MTSKTSSELTNRKQVTPLERRRAAYDRLIASLKVPQHTSIATPQPGKALPASGVFASV